MSNNLLGKKEQSFTLNKTENAEKKSKDNLINPTSFLSSDLLKEINIIEEKNIEKTKEITPDDNIQLDDTQKESDENEEDEEEKGDFDKDIFIFQIFQNDNKENAINKEKFCLEKNDKSKTKPKQQSLIYLNNIHRDQSNIDPSLFLNESRSFSNDYDIEQNRNYNIFNAPITVNNNMQNQFQFFNNSFTMNGRAGWVCINCKNFNYDSKLIIIFIFLLFLNYFIFYSKN